MNTADRSIARMDHALRRRFAFVRLDPRYDLLSERLMAAGLTATRVTELCATLEALRDAQLRLGLITNGRRSIQGKKVDGLGIRRFLDVVLISESIGVRKPDPRIFAEALAQMGIAPAFAVYVGDNPEVDIVGAKRSGLLAVWKRDRYWAEPQDADWVIDDLGELLPLVLGRGVSRNLSA